MFYKLDEDKKVVPSTIEEWTTMIEGRLPTNYIHVGDDTINGFRISTVFMGIWHGLHSATCAPIVFETMVFDDNADIYAERHCTWDEALEGHQRAIQWVKNGCVYEY